MTLLSWNEEEEAHFQKLLQSAYERDIQFTIEKIKLETIWLQTEESLYDFYNQMTLFKLEMEKRHQKNQARLMQLGKFLAEGLITEDQIQIFSSKKQEIILQNASMWKEEEEEE